MSETAEQWAVVELLGHVKLAGKVSEEERFGGKLGRIDVPMGGGFVTQHFGAGAVYRISYVTEEVARHVARQSSFAPVQAWDFPRPQLAAPGATAHVQGYEEDLDDEGDRGEHDPFDPRGS